MKKLKVRAAKRAPPRATDNTGRARRNAARVEGPSASRAKVSRPARTEIGHAPRAKVLSAPRSNDPFLERERGNYEEPVPSRELILQTLEAQGVPVSSDKLGELLRITASEQEGFDRRLAAMQRDGQVMRNRRDAICVVTKLDLITGTVQGHPDGFGFVVRDGDGPDLFLGPQEMHKVLHGDRVVVREAGMDRRGRPEAKIVEVLARAAQEIRKS